MAPDRPGAAPVRAWANLAGYYAALGGIGLVVTVLGPTLPALAVQTGSTLAGISLLFVARAGGYLLGSWLGGRLLDRLPGHPLMAFGGAALAAALALTPLTPWLWLLAAVTAVIGAAEAWIDVGSNTLIVWTFGDRVGPFMNGLHFAFGVGAFISPLIVAQALAAGGGIRPAYWVLALLSLPPAVWLLRQPSPPRPAPAAAGAGRPADTRLVALFAACFFFYAGAEVSFGAWLYTYANATGLAQAASGAYLTSAFWAALTAGRLAAIPLAARVRPRTLLAIDLVGGLVSVGCLVGWPGQAAVLWLGAVGTGFFMASIFPTLLALAGRRLALTGRITSLFFIGASLGGTVWPWVIGQLFVPLGPWVAPALVFASLALDALAFGVLLVLAPRAAAAAAP